MHDNVRKWCLQYLVAQQATPKSEERLCGFAVIVCFGALHKHTLSCPARCGVLGRIGQPARRATFQAVSHLCLHRLGRFEVQTDRGIICGHIGWSDRLRKLKLQPGPGTWAIVLPDTVDIE